MKMKTLLLTLLAATILSTNVIKAEEGTAIKTKKNIALGKKPAASEIPKNVVKLNLFPFGLMAVGLKNFSLQYERALNNKISVGLGLSFMPSSGLPSKFTASDSIGIMLALKLKGYAITPEFRFYPGKKGAPKGFYLAPYLRYSSYTMSTNLNHTQIDTTTTPHTSTYYNWDVKGKYTFIGGGIMIGVHYMIKNRVSIDWGILGLHAGASKVSMNVSDPTTFAQLAAAGGSNDLKNKLNDSFGNMPGSASVDVTNTGFTVDWKPPFAGGIRSLVGGWLTIGVAF